jgi:H+/Cl- antiporter ClcA
VSDFYTRNPVAMWRIVFYGILAAVGVAAIGYFQHDHRLYFAAAFCGVVIGGFGFVLSWTRASVKLIQTEPGQPKRFPRWVYWMFWMGLLASAALSLWDILRNK